MERIADLVAQLRDINKDRRCAAAEQLRDMPALPPYAITALERAAYDAVPEVADRASAALAVHSPPSLSLTKTLLSGREVMIEVPAVPGSRPAPAPATVTPIGDANARFLGAGICFVAIIIGYFTIFTPLADAFNAAPTISYHGYYALLTALGMLAGLVMLVLGERGYQLVRQKPGSEHFIAAVVACGIFALAFHFGMNWLLRALGYSW